jgi:hypothetical protein
LMKLFLVHLLKGEKMGFFKIYESPPVANL